MKEYKVEGHVSSYLPKNKEWKLVWNDEFDGTELDKTKWMFRTHFWGRKSPTWVEDEGAILDGEGCLHMPLILKDGNFYSSHIQTGYTTYDIPKDTNGFWPFGQYKKPLFMHKYGYYEIRCKQPKNAGWHAAFWIQAPGIGAHPDPRYGGVEVDIMESYKIPKTGEVICGNGWNGYGKDSKWAGHIHFPFVETEDGWHTYAVDWHEDGYDFYADGKLVGTQGKPDCPVSEVEEYLIVSTECHGYHRCFCTEVLDAGAMGGARAWAGVPVVDLRSAELPDEFVVDYVRVFDHVK